MEKKVISEEILREELTPEQWEKFEKLKHENGIQAALMHLPSLDSDGISSGVNARIKEIRLEHGFSQQDIANVLDVSQREYWRWEQDGYAVNILRLAELAIFYNVSLDWFSGYHITKKPFYESQKETCVNGYILTEFKEAKARGEKYQPHSKSL